MAVEEAMEKVEGEAEVVAKEVDMADKILRFRLFSYRFCSEINLFLFLNLKFTI